jgi:hypothetical protein
VLARRHADGAEFRPAAGVQPNGVRVAPQSLLAAAQSQRLTLAEAASYLPTRGRKMTAAKVSVSIDQDDLRWLRRQAQRKRKSLSAVLTETVRQARRERALDDVLRWLDVPPLALERLEELRGQWDAD